MIQIHNKGKALLNTFANNFFFFYYFKQHNMDYSLQINYSSMKWSKTYFLSHFLLMWIYLPKLTLNTGITALQNCAENDLFGISKVEINFVPS